MQRSEDNNYTRHKKTTLLLLDILHSTFQEYF
jgi:hypothetical protein